MRRSVLIRTIHPTPRTPAATGRGSGKPSHPQDLPREISGYGVEADCNDFADLAERNESNDPRGSVVLDVVDVANGIPVACGL